jgi:hypothetical protein
VPIVIDPHDIVLANIAARLSINQLKIELVGFFR